MRGQKQAAFAARARLVKREGHKLAAEVLTLQIVREGKALVANDLCVLAVQADAGIVLTEDEKTRLLDKYAEKYASNFGYDREYVKKNLADLVYESMLYDKTTEYLILHNTFVD